MSYQVIDTIHDPDGVSARITARIGAGGLPQFTWQFFRTYEQDGELKETVWFSPRHTPAMVRLLALVDERIKLERDRQKYHATNT